jgi:DNA helicase IV
VARSELEVEREVVARLYTRLDELRAETADRLADTRRESVGGNHQARSERDAFAQLYEDQLTQYREVDARLVFGRLLLETPDAVVRDAAEAASGEVDGRGDAPTAAELLEDPAIRYIGRVGLRDEDQRSLLMDWRAPQASAFYRATAATPLGVRARRHLTMRDRAVLRVDDEVFDEALLADESARTSPDIQGEGALLAAVTAQRTGRMQDIVATIQGEQDRIIRSEPRGALVVQGGPGTGKTAVALHRAAYLLYSNRERLSSAGVLVVGPSPAFMSYIDAVLPSLGETGVVMQTIGELYPGVTATEEDEPQVAVLKGSRQMASLIARAVRSRQRVPDQVETVRINGDELAVEPSVIGRAIEKARRTGKPHNDARVTFVRQAIGDLADQLAAQLRRAGKSLDDEDLKALREDLRSSYEIRVILNTAWLPLSPEKLIGDLFARPAWLAELTPSWPAERRALLARGRDAPFTVSDVPLLDEAAELLGDFPQPVDPAARERDRQRKRDLANARAAIRNMGVQGLVSADRIAGSFGESEERGTTAERARADRRWAYGHVVVDEAQELSAMQWRALVRRCPTRSFTIVGDIAQVSSAAGARDWSSALTPFFKDHWRLEELTVNYRTPAQIAREAARFAEAHGLPITPARAVREGDWPIEHAHADSAEELASAVVDAVRRDRGIDPAGTVAVIAPVAALAGLDAEFRAAFGAEAGRGDSGLDHPISLLRAHDAKGLEFDSVVLADPDALMAESERGASALYVAMTRPTQRLTLVGVGKREADDHTDTSGWH